MGILSYRRSLEQQTGLTKVVFSQPTKTSQALEDDILRVCCTPPIRISIDSDNFLRFFRIEDQVLKIMHAINDEVERFKKIIRKFFEVNPMFRQAQVDLDKVERQSIDMLFEFNAWMTEEITHAQKRVSKINNFTFTGEGMLNEAGHIANLTNQLKIVLLDVRMTCLQYTKQGIDQMRKCPHCGLVWTKVVGCEGETTCGNLVGQVDVRGANNGIMATFTFSWDDAKELLKITRSGERRALKFELGNRRALGCGKSITWSAMQEVSVPSEFCATQTAQVDDVATLPKQLAPTFERKWNEAQAQFQVRDARDDAAGARRGAAAPARTQLAAANPSFEQLQQAAYEMDGFAS